MSVDSFVSLAEAAACKGVHYQTVRKAIKRGDLKAIKVGAGVIITLSDLHAWQPTAGRSSPLGQAHLRHTDRWCRPRT
jgi:excisionase family DNA binding protein